MIFTVDRIEGNVVLLEDENGDILSMPADRLPPCRAGDVLCEADGMYTVDVERTNSRRDTVYALEQKLRQKPQK